MYSPILLFGAASLVIASTAYGQMAERALLSRTQIGYTTPGRFSASATAGTPRAPGRDLAGERVLLGRVDNRSRPMSSAGFVDTPVDGAQALLGKRPSILITRGKARRSSFRSKVGGAITASASGGAEFGLVDSGDGRTPSFVVSLGSQAGQSAILFTHMTGSPLGTGRYRITSRGNGAAEVLALVTTGTPTNPTGVFRGRSGWLVVTAAPDGLLIGRFHVDAVGFLAAEPELEDRAVSVTGSFSAAATSS